MKYVRIPFNKPYLTGKEAHYIYEAVYTYRHISGNGEFTKRCQKFFEQSYGIRKAFLTCSCTDALEMCGILLNIKEGDEVIIPSFTFVSTANAFVLRGAKIIFADSYDDQPNIDPDNIEALITPRTRAIVPVHYAGVACDMGRIMHLGEKYNLLIIEDAAQAVDSFYQGQPLGSIGQLAAFSFHETKNIISGEGGLLAVNDGQFFKRAEIIWEKGTNRAEFFRGEVDKYSWVDIGSSFLPSDIIAAYLYAQIEHIQSIQKKRKNNWEQYYNNLKGLETQGRVKLPTIPVYATNNAHMFYIICKDQEERAKLIGYLKNKGIMAVFHYQSLHKSLYYADKHGLRPLKNSDMFSDCLLRLPFYYDLGFNEIDFISEEIINFYN